MEEEANFTENISNYSYEPTGWDIAGDAIILIATLVGITANCIIIYMVARHTKMRNKTNVIIMNISICDALFLLSNVRYLTSLMQMLSLRHASPYVECTVGFLDASFQTSTMLWMMVLVSNTLLKSKRVKRKWLLTFVYGFVIATTLVNAILCHFDGFPVLYLLGGIAFCLMFLVVFVKEINATYKKCWKKDPLSKATEFRLNIASIYSSNWFLLLFFLHFGLFGGFFYAIGVSWAHMSSLAILVYIVSADKNFKICFLGLVLCGKGIDYNVDATITFCEDLSDNDEDDRKVNININHLPNEVATSA